MKPFLGGFVLWIVLCSSSFAQSYDDALALFNDGKFEETVDAGRTLNTAPGYALALRAQLVLVQYVYEPEVRLGAIERAIEDGEKAVALDPSHLEANLNLGIIIGLRGKLTDSISDGKKSRDLFEKGVAMAPNNSWALGTLASWHGETVYRAGKILGRLLFGARRKRALELFAKAMEVEPDNLTIRAAYIRALIKLDREEYAELIAENIAYMEKAVAANALERLMKEQIRQIKTAMDTGKESRLQVLLEEAVPLQAANP